ncbi:hypothetical protein N0V82_009107 [Gnomoniopsis sp. IMI 355080]|nr:hypothetical protein N0V82_009107 [Gnomoniopsis sp. IMI 355080]
MAAHKNVLITGAARGIGRVIARHLALLGHNIFLIDIQQVELEYTATSHIPKCLSERTPNGVAPVQKEALIGYKVCDLRDPAAINDAVQAAASFFPGGEIDVLINNAGLCKAQFKGGRTMEDPGVLAEWTAYLAVNLTAPFLVSQACLPFMKHIESGTTKPFEAVIRPEAAQASSGFLSEEARRGFTRPEVQSRCIINISSFRALQSEPNCEGYAASKAGMLGLTQAMAVSGAQWGIRCNAVLPGFTFVDHECKEADESRGKMWWTEGIDADRHRHHPVGRIGYGEDVADAIVWLMGAGFVTGQEICVDGGISKVKHVSA